MAATAENERVVTILWNGGWDTYLIKPCSVRSMTAEEAEYFSRRKWEPTIAEWLRCSFVKAEKLGDDATLVRIVKHLDGGD